MSRVKVPTLVLHSRDDAVVPVQDGIELANGIAGARFVLLDSRNHLLVPGEPAWHRFVAEVQRFLAEFVVVDEEESMNEAITRWLSLRAYGAITSTLFRATTPPETMRRRFERFGATSRAAVLHRHPRLAFADHAIGRLAIEGVRAVEAPSRALLYLHGGAYVMGSPASYRSRAARLSYRCNAEVFVPDYRLAPEHPFPAALVDALAAWRYVQALRSDMPVFVVGDSAGGGLALSLAIRLRQLGEPLPAGLIAISPWANLSASGAAGDHKDLWSSRAHLQRWASYYVGDADPCDPLVSPAFADFSGLPPLLVLVGEDELLAYDALHVVDAARRGGTDVRVLVGKGMQHDWPLTLPWLDESRRAWQAMATFVADQACDGANVTARARAMPASRGPTR